MKPLLHLSIRALLLTTPTFAMMSIEDVSPARAKELGLELKSNPAGPDATFVELTFKPEGSLKSFARVDLEIYAQGKLQLFASLKEEHPTSGHDLNLKDFLTPPKAAADAEAQFLAAVQKSFTTRDPAAISAVTNWDHISDSVKRSTESTYAALTGEKDATFEFKVVAPDKQLLTAAEKYTTNLPITHQLNMIGRDPKDNKRILMILTFAVGEKDGKLLLLPCIPK
jgi:hypothetical protein